jgi:hypothetical protein
VGTHVVWWLEFLGPVLAFIPWRNGFFRTLACALFMGFHAALFATLRINLFPLVGMAAWLAFLPPAFWNFRRRFPGPDSKISHVSQSWWAQTVAGVLMLLVIGSNVADWLRFRNKTELPQWLDTTLYKSLSTLRIKQTWRLFAPPLAMEGWYVTVLEYPDGSAYDALTGKEVSWDRPGSLADRMPSVNWRRFLMAIREGDGSRARWYCAWLMREWEATHPGAKVRRIRLHYLWEWTAKRQKPPDNQLVYETPPGAMTEQWKKLRATPVDPGERGDN